VAKATDDGRAEPQGSSVSIKALLLEFRELDLGLDQDAEYEMVLANGACSLTIRTERHDHA